MATSRLLRTSRTVGFALSNSCSNSSQTRAVRCSATPRDDRDRRLSNQHGGRRQALLSVKASTAAQESISRTEKQIDLGVVDLASLVVNVGHAVFTISRIAVKQKPWRSYVQLFIENAIVNCRFFTLFAVAGSLLGSVLCFVEGCSFVLESYYYYYQALSSRSDGGQVVHLLMEALDMFLVATAMVIIGVSLFNMFVRSRTVTNVLGVSYTKAIPKWAKLQSVFQAKLKIGHALMLILQVGVVEKFKSVPLVSGYDLACFAGAVLFSSAATYVLSRLSFGGVMGRENVDSQIPAKQWH